MFHIDDFKLSGPFNIGETNNRNKPKILKWYWIDTEWYFDHEVGESGCEYNDLTWTGWGISPSSPEAYTRRRKWYRNALLIESWSNA